MKAILIDATKREISLADVQLLHITRAFRTPGNKIPVELSAGLLSPDTVLFYDRNAVLKHPADFFYIEGFEAGPVWGKALLLSHVENVGPSSATMTVDGAEALIAFHIKRPALRPSIGGRPC